MMRSTLKALLFLGVGLLMAGTNKGDGTSPTPGDSTKSDPPKKTPDGTPVKGDLTEAFDGVETDLTDGQVKDANGDNKPDITDNSLPTRSELPPFNISSGQFGKKWGKHAKDYGLDPGDPTSRQWFQDRATQVHDAPDDVRVGPYNPNGGGGPDYVFFRQGDDLVIMKPNGDFVTMFPMDPNNPNGWYQGATSIQ